MCKTREYRKAPVELCRHCGGRGYVHDPGFCGDKLMEVSVVSCPVCDGRGRVWKVNAGTVKIEPFTGQDRLQE